MTTRTSYFKCTHASRGSTNGITSGPLNELTDGFDCEMSRATNVCGLEMTRVATARGSCKIAAMIPSARIYGALILRLRILQRRTHLHRRVHPRARLHRQALLLHLHRS